MIIPFYANEAPDDKDRYLSDLQNWSDDALESYHDFIQWMFPLRERSGVNPSAPILDDATIQEFRARPELQNNLRRSFLRMLRFYGFQLQNDPLNGPLEVRRSSDFEERAENWLSPWNHNHLRITRILKSLTLLGLEAESRAFFVALSDVYAQQDGHSAISRETFRYWESTVALTRSAPK